MGVLQKQARLPRFLPIPDPGGSLDPPRRNPPTALATGTPDPEPEPRHQEAFAAEPEAVHRQAMDWAPQASRKVTLPVPAGGAPPAPRRLEEIVQALYPERPAGNQAAWSHVELAAKDLLSKALTTLLGSPGS